jgi:hypothetical protein
MVAERADGLAEQLRGACPALDVADLLDVMAQDLRQGRRLGA